MADQVVYENSNSVETSYQPFTDKRVLWVSDENSGSYSSGQIQITTSALSNSGRWVDYANGEIHIPIIITATSPAGDIGIANNAFAVGIKNGFYQFIHSVQISYNNTEVVQLTSQINHLINFQLMTSLTKNDVEKIGPTIGFFPDEPQGWAFGAAADAGTIVGIGSAHNYNRENSAWLTGGGYANTISHYNTGFIRRQLITNIDHAAANVATYQNDDRAASAGRNRYIYAANTYAAWLFDAVIRLKDLSSFFGNMPLTKGAFVRIVLNLNMATQQIRVPAGANRAMRCSAAPILTGGTCPFMVASCLDNPVNSFGASNLPLDGAAARTITFQTSVARSSVAGVPNHPLSSARLYVPTFTMNPINETDYITLNPTKTIKYQDNYVYTVNNIAAGATFSQLLTNGIAGATSICCLPYYAASQHPIGGVGANAIVASPMASPFAAEPGTTTPLIRLADFQIQHGGLNVFNENQQYEWAQFADELQHANALNGGVQDNLNSGLVSFTHFINNYRYYYADLSRRIPAEDFVAKSILISGRNDSNVAIDLVCFVQYSKQLTIKTENSEVLMR